ncbi:DUF2304 domain-containing protein [Candidatus Galacturonibacter soehngenii]|uniref:DUF2304 domain-containing protein n=1 Tax=Candidatus Galacturonatibacter soehngenii TaxID=2307010 RepID=A0A7V7QHH6_9FIRM|nr:DUF2304 domain-containing protein [Candidatus Galacturonibacter soehngenii]KAB1434399.1 DUF2304 domain-containing protein [Candidatus Galacturonibacter soehngenii]
MSFAFRIILILASLMTTLYIVRKIRYSKLQIEYAIFWIILSFLLILISIFPVLVTIPTNIIGMQAPVNFVFLVIIFILLIKAFMQTIEHSQLENKLNDLAQKIAIDEKISRDRQKDMETADSIEKMENEGKVK